MTVATTAAATITDGSEPTMSRLTPAERSQRATIAVYESWARTDDWRARTEPGRTAFLERFEREVDPDGTMDPALRAKRAEAKRRAYFQRLAFQSAKARRAKAAPDRPPDG